jgi:hypothetical protein
MAFSIFDPVRETELKGTLEVTSRVGAIFLIITYVFGFLVVTFANSTRGIGNFGLFRAKVLSAAILFLIFLMFPLLDWSRYFGKFGFPKINERLVKEAVVPEGRAKFYLLVTRLLSFFMSSLAMGWFLCLFVLQSIPSGRFIGSYIVFIAAAVGALMLCGFQFQKHPFACAALCLVLIGVGAAGLFFFKEREVGIVLVWFFFIGYIAHWIEDDFRKAQHLRNVTWHLLLLNAVFTLAVFATQLYPKIPPRLGGGQPTRALFQFANPSPLDGSAKNELWLLDEVDAGYYVLRSPDEHKAIFIPRSLVSAIYFEASEATTAAPH